MRYEAPTTTKEAVSLIAKAKGKSYVLAGGTDLLVKLKSGAVEPDLIVDIKRIEATQAIKKTASGFRIGAAVPGVQMGKSSALKKSWPGVVEAANLIGSDQIQGRCTIVGNLCNASPAADSVPARVTKHKISSAVSTAMQAPFRPGVVPIQATFPLLRSRDGRKVGFSMPRVLFWGPT